ncbi:MAG: hypothetical protein R2706_07290 [Acidimicrobiales bacterium]
MLVSGRAVNEGAGYEALQGLSDIRPARRKGQRRAASLGSSIGEGFATVVPDDRSTEQRSGWAYRLVIDHETDCDGEHRGTTAPFNVISPPRRGVPHHLGLGDG